jgi:hypothetical protein
MRGSPHFWGEPFLTLLKNIELGVEEQMKNISKLAFAFFGTASLLLVGCGGSDGLVPVSGKVTVDGQPLAGVRVVFNPLATSDNLSPGTWSSGLTNAEGEFTLVNKNRKEGAVIGSHAVQFEYDDVDADAMEDLKDDLELAKEEGSKADAAALLEEKKNIERLQKTRPRFSENFEMKFTVPDAGTKDANFEVSATNK